MDVIRFFGEVPKDEIGKVLGRQMLRCGTSVGANYRAACRARSAKEFRAKLGIVEEEADECLYWLDLLSEAFPKLGGRAQMLEREAGEILAMVVASINTSQRHG